MYGMAREYLLWRYGIFISKVIRKLCLSPMPNGCPSVCTLGGFVWHATNGAMRPPCTSKHPPTHIPNQPHGKILWPFDSNICMQNEHHEQQQCIFIVCTINLSSMVSQTTQICDATEWLKQTKNAFSILNQRTANINNSARILRGNTTYKIMKKQKKDERIARLMEV